MDIKKFEETTSLNVHKKQLEQLKGLFPELIDDAGKINFDQFKKVFSEADELIDENETFSFSWNGKTAAMRKAQEPVTETLRPKKDASKNWDETQNLYLEGDNLQVLKLLQKAYFERIKLIYLDPPYNTGKDFVYHDDFRVSTDDYLDQTNQVGEDGLAYTTNLETNGKFHTDWLNMMYPRLRVARNLLAEDGVIFVSIDDTEDANLRKTMDEIFGEQNFLAQVIWERAFSPVNLKKNFSESHDYILVYAKDVSKVVTNGLKKQGDTLDRYQNPDNDPRGPWTSGDLNVGPAVDKNIYPIQTPSGREVLPSSGYSWRLSQERFKEYVADNRIWFGESGDNVPRIKRFLSETKQGVTPMTIWKYQDVGHSQSASQSLKKLMGDKSYFSYPKPVDLMKRIVELYSNSDSYVLDFFSGSGTMAQAVMAQNQEDGGERKFIMVQLREKLAEKEVAYKDGYRYITEIAEERIRRAGELYPNVDTGFKVFTLDSTNIKSWQANYKSSDQTELVFDDQNIVEGRSDDDVLYEIMVKKGLDLNLPVTTIAVDGGHLYDIADGTLFVVTGTSVKTTVSDQIVKLRRHYENEGVLITSNVVFVDEAFDSTQTKLNIISELTNAGYAMEEIESI